MPTIKVANDFTMNPGARYYSDGPFSGEEFFDELLKPKFEQALNAHEKLTIDLDGTNGYASSFLDESFRRLKEAYTPDTVWRNLILISDEFPKYIDKIKAAIYGL